MIPISQLTRFTILGIDVCLFFIRSMEVLSRRSCTDTYFFIFVQLRRLRSLVMKSQTIFVCAFLLSTLVIYVLQLWEMTTELVNLPTTHILVILQSKPVIDLIYSSVDYADKVSLSVFLIQFSKSKE